MEALSGLGIYYSENRTLFQVGTLVMEKIRILIVEDEAVVALELKITLESLGYEVTDCVATGLETIASVAKDAPDLMLMDIRLKGDMDGIDAARNVQDRMDLPVIFLTAYADDEILKRARQIRPFGYLMKPINERDLKTAIEIAVYSDAIESKRKQAEKELQEREEQYDKLFNSMLNGFLLVEMIFDEKGEAYDWRYLKINPAMEKLMSRTAEEVVGKTILEVFQDFTDEWLTIFPRIADNPGGEIFELYAPVFGGYFQVAAYMLKENQVAAVFSDITPRKEAELARLQMEEEREKAREALEKKVADRTEELQTINRKLVEEIEDRKVLEGILAESETRYRNLVEGTRDLVTQIDERGQLLYVNPTANTIFGLPVEECLNKKWSDFVYPEDLQMTQGVLDDCLRNKQESARIENRQVNQSDGTVRHIGWTMHLNFDDDGKLRYINSIGQDITSQKETEENLRKAKTAADNANQAKSEFLANISHELRNPMHQILSYSKYGIKKITTAPLDKLLHYFNQIYKSGSRLTLLLNDLLDLSRLEAGSLSYQMSKHDLVRIVENAMDDVRELSRERGIELIFNTAGKRMLVVCDKLRIGQVVTNLLSNSLKFTSDSGNVVIDLASGEFQPVADGDGTNPGLKLSVTDTGVGIPEDELEAVFSRFVQSSKTKTGAGGTGLGLAICRQIIEGHQGKIWAENNPEGGAIFTFLIPASDRPSGVLVPREARQINSSDL